jgi:hypothetical protein
MISRGFDMMCDCIFLSDVLIRFRLSYIEPSTDRCVFAC